ncbi:XRE family transcriptional regulator [Actinomycetospora lutea]|uniref:helix-turn-helix domain-containing protein n=1 Tax=Actinomycetospora lutea TaxID=663604 RepID=UPI002365BEF3|nr:XRE family transcriptional regulator [Actinomycetospora lutea]MDD7938289.1 XRE family transcriptional regulator [Actinomycetospora lutea]
MARSAAEPAGPADTPRVWETVVDAIGPKVRDLRQQAGLSLQQLARRADVSAAAIHKVERGDMVPTITTLLKLADALERPIAHFVGDEGPTTVASVVAAGAGAEVTDGSGTTRTAITAAPERFRVGGAAVVVEPGAEGSSAGPQAGEELVHLLEGALEVEVAGERHVLGAGDTIQFPADRHTRWRNPGPGAARAVWLTTRGS